MDQKKTNILCGIERAELKVKKQASLWAYLKVLFDLVSKLEEYPDPRSIIN